MTTQRKTLAGRRTLLAAATAALFAAASPWQAMAQTPATTQTAVASAPAQPIEQLDNALLAAMKAGDSARFAQRYDALAPVVEQVFDLNRVLAESVGFPWTSLSPARKATLAAAFLRYTVATYVANFDSYNGQSFEVLPGVRNLGNGEVIVQTRLLRRSRSPVVLDYVMVHGTGGWKVVDVLTNGSISRVAVQRSDFQQLLSSGGAPALTAGLDRKAANLSSGLVG